MLNCNIYHNCNIYYIIKVPYKYHFPQLCVGQVGKLWQRSRGHSSQADQPSNKPQEEKLQRGNSSLSHHTACQKPEHRWVTVAALAVPDSSWVMGYKRER